ILCHVARDRLTGRLDFTAPVGGPSFAPRSFYVEDGMLVGATSASPGDRIEESALRQNFITREQHRRLAGALAGLATRRAAMMLLESGLIKPQELTVLVDRRTEEVVYGLFGQGELCCSLV